jgi:hypothetical protein
MKKSELKQIIKEEVEKTLNEATVKIGPYKNFILKSDKNGVQLMRQDPNDMGRVNSQVYIFKDEIPDVIAFLNNMK